MSVFNVARQMVLDRQIPALMPKYRQSSCIDRHVAIGMTDKCARVF